MFCLIICIASVLAVVVQSKIPTDGLFFYETFDAVDPFSSGTWLKSLNEKYRDQPLLIKPLTSPIKGFESDKGIQLTEAMKHYAFSSKFAEPLVTKEKDIVVQYELKLEEGLTCGGAYVKMPMAAADLDLSQLNSDTRYSIMFGPDKCGSNNKIHFIIQYQNPISKEWEEKHFNTTIAMKSDKMKTHLYTLHIKSNSDFEIYVDMKEASRGNLLTHMTPPINPERLIDDKDDRQPADWVTENMMADPSAVKPADWDEEAPKMIENAAAVKPAGWGDDSPLEIPDPEALRPDDWDDEEDGVWEAPTLPNPVCAAVGCGEWKRPKMVNPAYKGKWNAPLIKNPLYIGVWAPRKIENALFFEDLSPASSLAPMAGIAVEVWTTNAGIFFDNFVVAHSLKEAFGFADATYTLKAAAEEAAEAEDRILREKEAALKEKTARAQRTDLQSRVMAKLEEASQFLYANAFASIGTVAAITLCLVLAATESMRRKKTEKKRVAVTPDTTAATAAATATTAAAVEVTASAAAAAAPVTIPAAVADSSE